jgi:hypothetical protein
MGKGTVLEGQRPPGEVPGGLSRRHRAEKRSLPAPPHPHARAPWPQLCQRLRKAGYV